MKASDSTAFLHDADARNDTAILELRAKFGWEAYGIFWALVETMRAERDYRIDLNRIAGLSFGFNVEDSKLISIINLCVELGLFNKEGSCIHSPSLKRRMESYQKVREKRVLAGRASAETRKQILHNEDFKLAAQELTELKQEFGNEAIDYYIQIVKDYLTNKGETKADYPAYVRNWIKKDAAEQRGFYSPKRVSTKPLAKRPEHKIINQEPSRSPKILNLIKDVAEKRSI